MPVGCFLYARQGTLSGPDQVAVLALDSNRFQLWVMVNARPPLDPRAHPEAGLEVAFTPAACEGRLDDVLRHGGLLCKRYIPGAAVERRQRGKRGADSFL